MATIPTLTTPRQQVQPAAGIAGFNATQNIRGTAGAFGEAGAAATAQLAGDLGRAAGDLQTASQTIGEADLRIERRENALRRRTALSGAETEAQRLFTAAEVGGDFSDPNQVVALREQFQTKFTELEESYPASNLEEDRLRFLEGMQGIRARWDGLALSAGLEAGRAGMKRAAQETASGLSDLVAANPGAVADAHAAYRKWIEEEHAPAMPAEDTAVALQAGLEGISQTAIEFLLTTENYLMALEQIESPLIGSTLSETVKLSLRLRAWKGLGKQGKQAGILSPADTKAFGFQEGTVVARDTKGDFEVLQEPDETPDFSPTILSPDQTTEAGFQPGTVVALNAKGDFKVLQGPEDDDTDPLALLGAGIEGRATMALTARLPEQQSLIERFERGDTTPQEDDFALIMIEKSMQTNERTGEIIIAPPFRRALRARGIDPETFGDPVTRDVLSRPRIEAAPISGSEPTAGPTGALEQAPDTPEQAPDTLEQALDPSEQALFGPETVKLFGDRTIAELVMEEGFTGIGPAVKEFLGRTPIVGSGAGLVDALRSAIPLAQERLVSALQKNPRFAVTERTQISEKLNIDPKLWDNSTALLGRLVGIADFLGSLETELTDAISNPTTPREQRRADRSSLVLIQAMRERLTPEIILAPDIKKRDDLLRKFAEENPPGTPVVFMDKNGIWTIRRTRQQAPAKDTKAK